MKTVLERAEPKIDFTDDCWLWTGAKYLNGYGVLSMRIDGRWTPRGAHRVVYEAVVGPIPKGLELDHLCRNKGCVNPDHLEPVTHLENVRRAVPTHCPSGHPYSGDNVYFYRKGRSRQCQTCRREHTRKGNLKTKLNRRA